MSQFCGVRDIHIVITTHLHNLFILPTETTKPLNNNSVLPFPQLLATSIPFSVCMDVTFLGTSYKWNMFDLVFWLISRSIMSLRFIHVAACIRISFLRLSNSFFQFLSLSLSLYIYIYIYMPHFINPFTYQWKPKLILLWLLYNTANEHKCASISLRPCFQFFWVYTQ